MSQVKPISYLHEYTRAIEAGSIRPDSHQQQAAAAFERLYQQLTGAPARRRFGLFSPGKKHSGGLYVYGDVGRGKSMLMDMFVATIGTMIPTHRAHFHAFMRDIHKRLFHYRQRSDGDALHDVIAEIAAETTILCLDELQVSDVTDAMILARLFSGLMDAGIAIIFTSNRHPRALYQGGLQRDQFLKFVDLLEARMPIISIDSPEDYRLAQLKSIRRTYVYPRNEASDDFLLASWNTLTHGMPNEPLRIEIDGRLLRLDKHAHGIAWLTFAELCARPLGAGDYLELTNYCHTILLQGIPRLAREDRNEAKRFVTLIDTLYDRRIKLVATAETPPEGIYEHGDGTFEFARTVSRLIEMQSEAYLAAPRA
jgi:cell division protein ZapE